VDIQLIANFSLSELFFTLSVVLLLIASVLDTKDQEVDWRILLGGVLSAVVYVLIIKNNYLSVLYGLFSAIIVPLVIIIASKERWMGLGDLLFAAMVGLLCGFPLSVVAVFSAFLAGSIFGIIYLCFNPRAKELAFGPFLTLGFLIAWVFGRTMIDFLSNIIA